LPAAAVEIDEKVLHDVLSSLSIALAEDDFAAGKLLDRHEALLRTALDENFNWIADAIRDFNYSAALDWLKEAAAHRGITL